MAKNTSFIGILQLAIAQCTIGVSLVISKYLVTIFPIWLLLGIRFSMSALLSIALLQCSKEKIYKNRRGETLNFNDWSILFAQAVCAGFLFNVLIVVGLKYTGATAAGIISSAIPAAIVIFSYIFLKEKITRGNTVAIVIIMFGLIILSLGNGSAEGSEISLIGDFFILLAVIPEALFTIIVKWYGDSVKPIVMMAIVNIFNALLFLPFVLWSLSQIHFVNASLQDWGLLLLLAISSNILFYLFWYQGVAKTTTHIAALFTGIMPVSAAILAYLFLHEHIYWYHLIGMACVVFSVSLGTIIKKNALSLQSRSNI